MKVSVIDNPDSSDGKNIVVMQFLFGGKPVRFAGSETATCNGVQLVLNALVFGYAERVPIEPVGGAYNFVYTQNGVSTPVNLTVPARPVINSPANGDNVTRLASVPVAGC